jgi:hypothetical protein
VDKAGTSVLIRFQPLASDFRTVLATVKLGSHLNKEHSDRDFSREWRADLANALSPADNNIR